MPSATTTARRSLTLAMLACSALASPAWTQSWTGVIDSDPTKGGNWSTGVAPLGSSVLIDSLTNAPIIDNGQTFGWGTTTIGADAPGLLTVSSGALNVNGGLGIGGGQINGTAGDGRLLVSGAGTIVTTPAQIFVGSRTGSRGVLDILGNGTVRGQSLIIGTAPGSTGIVTVTNSTLDIGNGALYMGQTDDQLAQRSAQLNIIGGTFTGGNSVTHVVGEGASVLVRGGQMTVATALGLTGDLRVEAGGQVRYDTIGTGEDARITIDGATVEAAAIGSSGGFTMGGSSSLVATGGSALRVGSQIRLSEDSVMTLTNTAVSANSVRILGNAVMSIGAADGSAPGTAGQFVVANGFSLEQANTKLVINHDGRLTFDVAVHGTGTVLHRSGTTIIGANAPGSTLSGAFDLTGGSVSIGGLSRYSNFNVSNGATLTGGGTLDGLVTIHDGILAPGHEGVLGTLRVGQLTLSPESILNYQLGTPGSPGVGSDLLRIGTADRIGHLTLDGTLNIADAGGFGAGLYRLMEYSGTLTDNGLAIGQVPASFTASGMALQTSVAGQINLTVAAPVELLTFWDGGGTASDGIVTGGAGTWTATATNWTNADGTRTGAYDPSRLLIFAGTGGSVTVSSNAGAITAPGGLQFAADGYRLAGDPIGFSNGAAIIRVGDGSNAGAAFTTGIASTLRDMASLTKTDLGTLAISGRTTVTGGLAVQAGSLAVRDGGALVASGLYMETGSTLSASGAGTTLTIGGTAQGDIRGDLVIADSAVARMTPAAVQITGSLSVTGGAQLISDTAVQGWTIGQEVDFLVSGQESLFITGNNLVIGASLGDRGTGMAVIADGATVQINSAVSSQLAFGVARTLEVRDGASLAFGGGGLLMNRGTLLVQNASVGMDDRLVMGSIHGDNVLTLIDADFRATAITGAASSPGTIINLGGTLTGAAGGIRSFDVPTLQLSSATDQFVINHNNPRFTLESVLGGVGTIRHVAGDTRLTGFSDGFAGTLLVEGGHVRVDGILGSNASQTEVSGGAILSGQGRIGGSVIVGTGTIAPGGEIISDNAARFARAAAVEDDRVGLLTIDGALTLSGESSLLYQLGAPEGIAGEDSDLINVGGDLILDGIVDVVSTGAFGDGVYRLINYGGALTDNGLAIGLVPEGYTPDRLTVQTSVASQVNLLVQEAPPTPASFNFWDGSGAVSDGTVAGGTGTWTSAASNWTLTAGDRNGNYDPTLLLIFGGAAGTVTVDDASGPVAIGTGAQFATTGYRITGDALRLDGPEVQFRVGDGTSSAITATIDAALTGTAGIAKTDLGTLILTGANSYEGGTRIAQGTLRGTTTSLRGPLAIASAGTLHFDQAADGSYTGQLSGNGAVLKSGAGTLTFTGNSIGFAGTTRTSAGTLSLTGALGGATQIDAGASLVGNGRLGTLDIAGRVAPGTGAAILTVEGDLAFRAGSTYAVDLMAAGSTDRINAGGRATIEGGTVAVTTLDPETSYGDGALYRILNAAGGVTGRFSALTEQSAFLDFALEYDPTGASIRLSQIRLFPDVALSYNQRQAATGLKELDRIAGSDALAVYNAILPLDEVQARQAFDASSGEIYADILAGEQRQTLALSGQYALRSVAAIDEGLGMWGGVTGRRAHVARDGNAAQFTQDGAGFETGIDYRGRGNGWAVGVGGGWQSGNIHAGVRNSHADTHSWYLGGYARLGSNGAGFTLAVSAVQQWTAARITRGIQFGTLSRTANARTDVRTVAGRIDLRYGMPSGHWSFGPAANVEASSSRMDGFMESGAQALNLSAGSSGDRWIRYGIGAFARLEDAKGNVDIAARLVTGSRNDADITLTLAGSPQPFTVRASRVPATGGLVEMSGRHDLGGNWSLSGQASVLATGKETSLNGGARLSFRF